MRPLRPDERQDLQLVVSVADDWLAQLEHADDNTVGVLWQAMTLTQATARAQGGLLFRVLAPDTDDATAQRNELARLNAASRAGLQARWGHAGRKVSRQQLEKAVRVELKALRARGGVPVWSKVCDAVGMGFGVSGRRVREILKDSPVKPRRR